MCAAVRGGCREQAKVVWCECGSLLYTFVVQPSPIVFEDGAFLLPERQFLAVVFIQYF
jgi:hypothetical protein